MKRKLHLILIAVIAMFLLSGCIMVTDTSGYGKNPQYDYSSFMTGVWLLLTGITVVVDSRFVGGLMYLFDYKNCKVSYDSDLGIVMGVFWFGLTTYLVDTGIVLSTDAANDDLNRWLIAPACGVGVAIIMHKLLKNFSAIHKIFYVWAITCMILSVFIFMEGSMFDEDMARLSFNMLVWGSPVYVLAGIFWQRYEEKPHEIEFQRRIKIIEGCDEAWMLPDWAFAFNFKEMTCNLHTWDDNSSTAYPFMQYKHFLIIDCPISPIETDCFQTQVIDTKYNVIYRDTNTKTDYDSLEPRYEEREGVSVPANFGWVECIKERKIKKSKKVQSHNEEWDYVWICEEHNIGYKLNKRTKIIQVFTTDTKLVYEGAAQVVKSERETWGVTVEQNGNTTHHVINSSLNTVAYMEDGNEESTKIGNLKRVNPALFNLEDY